VFPDFENSDPWCPIQQRKASLSSTSVSKVPEMDLNAVSASTSGYYKFKFTDSVKVISRDFWIYVYTRGKDIKYEPHKFNTICCTGSATLTLSSLSKDQTDIVRDIGVTTAIRFVFQTIASNNAYCAAITTRQSTTALYPGSAHSSFTSALSTVGGGAGNSYVQVSDTHRPQDIYFYIVA